VRTFSIKRVLSTKLNRGFTLGRRRVTNLQTGCTTQQILHSTGVLISNFSWVNLHDRPRKVFLTHATITYYHYFFKCFSIFLKLNAHLSFATQGQLHSFVTYVSDYECTGSRHTLKGKSTIEVGNGTARGITLLHHTGTYNGFTRSIGHYTSYINC